MVVEILVLRLFFPAKTSVDLPWEEVLISDLYYYAPKQYVIVVHPPPPTPFSAERRPTMARTADRPHVPRIGEWVSAPSPHNMMMGFGIHPRAMPPRRK